MAATKQEPSREEVLSRYRQDTGSTILNARKRKNMSQDELSSLTGVSTAQIRRIEKGESRANKTTLMKLSPFLDIPYPEDGQADDGSLRGSTEVVASRIREEIQGKVREYTGTFEEVSRLKEIYGKGQIMRRRAGFVFRAAEEELKSWGEGAPEKTRLGDGIVYGNIG